MSIAELDIRVHTMVVDRAWDRLSKTLIEPCEVCGGSGHMASPVEDWIDGSDIVLVPAPKLCKCKKKAIWFRRLAEAGVPEELWLADKIEPVKNKRHFALMKDYAKALDLARERGLHVLFMGENGVGKTSSACIPLIKAARRGKSIAFIPAPAYVQGLKRAWRDTELQHSIEERTLRDFVVLDELGKEPEADDALIQIDLFIRLRVGGGLPTFITTNLTMAQMQRRYGDSVMSLINRFKRLSYEPGDYRQQMAPKWEGIE